MKRRAEVGPDLRFVRKPFHDSRAAARPNPESHRAERHSIGEMQASVTRAAKIPISEVASGRGWGRTALPRSIAILACRDRTAATAREIAGHFNWAPASVAALSRRTKALVETNGAAKRLGTLVSAAGS